MARFLSATAFIAVFCATTANAAFDQRHATWTGLLAKHVVVLDGGKASLVDYGGMAQDSAALKTYLRSLETVTESEFLTWAKAEQLAFLINAYNAHMIELVLTRYPDIRSVWDFGRVLNNPFKTRFFKLFGRDCSLDMIEHDTIRARGVYDDPRVHFAVNCASAGCPMLREEAYVGERLDAQLEQQTRRFLGERSRNRFDAASGQLQMSEIFRWYADDFERGYRGTRSVRHFLSAYAAVLADSPEAVRKIAEQQAAIQFLPYDWRLNAARSGVAAAERTFPLASVYAANRSSRNK